MDRTRDCLRITGQMGQAEEHADQQEFQSDDGLNDPEHSDQKSESEVINEQLSQIP